MPRLVVVTPTYDEAPNIAATIGRILAAAPDAEVLVVDDASPDGTGELADRIAAADPRVHVLHRAAKDGLGRAYIAGFRWALDRGYDLVAQLDADGSHPPEALPALRAALDDPATGLAIGSRWVPGGSVVGWPWYRRRLSVAANAYARRVLRLPVRDVTAGFRVYRAAVLAALPLESIDSRGYCFQVDMTLRTSDAGWRIAERPIVFRERVAGRSKMTGAIVAEAMLRTTWWAIARALGHRPRMLEGRDNGAGAAAP